MLKHIEIFQTLKNNKHQSSGCKFRSFCCLSQIYETGIEEKPLSFDI